MTLANSTSRPLSLPADTAIGGARRPALRRRRDRIVDVAIEMFSTTEYDDVSIDELCRRAGVAKGLAFYHFNDKRGIFSAALAHVWAELVEYQRPLPTEESLTDRMHGFLRRQFEYVERHPQRFSVLMSTGHHGPEVRDIVLQARQEAAAGIMACLGCPASPPPRLRQAILGWAQFVDSVAMDWIANRDTTIEDMTEMCIQVLTSAVRSTSEQNIDNDGDLRTLAQVMNQSR